MKKILLRYYLPVVIALVMLLGIAIPAMGATTADVTVTATGAFVSYAANQTTYNFGIVNTSSTTNTSGVWIEFTNSSTVSTNISVKMLANAWTSAGTGWTHSDTAAGANTAAMKANSDNTIAWSTSVFIKYTAPFNEIAQAVAPSAGVIKVNSGLSLLAPTSFTDGNTNNNTIRFSFYAS